MHQSEVGRVPATAIWQLIIAIVMAIASASAARAQQAAEFLRGRVVGPDGAPIADVLVTSTSFTGGIQRTDRTNKDGRYSIVYPNGEGIYWVQTMVLGYVSKRVQVRRRADNEVIIGDFQLAKTEVLSEVNVSASVGRITIQRNTPSQDVSARDRSITSNFVSIAPELVGNLAAQAAALPGVQLIPGVDGAADRFSIFGLGGDQNNVTVNGMQQELSRLPRDANASVQLRSGYDIATGGASGATIAVTTNSGTNQKIRPVSILLNAPQAQWSDGVGRAAQYSSISIGGRATGPRYMDKDFYNVAVQFDHRSQYVSSLTSATRSVLQNAGVSDSSAARLREILTTLHVPILDSRKAQTSRTSGSLLATLDWASKSPASGQALTLTMNGGFQNSGPQAESPLLATSALASHTSASAGVSVRHTNYLQNGIFIESVFSASGTATTVQPLMDAPSALVLVTSNFADAEPTTRAVLVGGGSAADRNRTLSLGARNTLSRISDNNWHRLKLQTELGYDQAGIHQAQNTNGRFTYQSLENFSLNEPSSYSRTLNAESASGGQIIAAIGLGDTWRVSRSVQVQYGLRVDANKFIERPARNVQLQTSLSADNTHLPNRIYLSPRIGFSKVLEPGFEYEAAPDVYRFRDDVMLTGGIGLFQNLGGSALTLPARMNTGLADATQQIDCIGAAVPTPDWNLLQVNPGGATTTCLADPINHRLAFESPSIAMFSGNFVQPRSLRSTLSWSSMMFGDHVRVAATGLYSENFNQTDYVDRNVRRTEQFPLASEAGRSVFASKSGIDPASGLIAPAASRMSQEFGFVTELRSDLRSRTAQLSLNVNQFSFNEPFNVGAWYTYTNMREQYRGFASAGRDPLLIHAGRAALPSHDIGFSVRYKIRSAAVVSLYSRLTSGYRFTPVVAGDINGDGIPTNDRAFVPAPASTDDSELSGGVQELLTHGSSTARSCLGRQLNTIVGRNSCTGPWTMGNSLMQVIFNSVTFGGSPRATVSLSLSNPIAAVDLLVHGGNQLRGWGQSPTLDRSLLYVRGFDADASQFKYDVNPRFGRSSASMGSRTPVVLTARISFDLAPRRDWQDLQQALERGRSRAGARLTEGAARQYATNTGYLFINVMAQLLRSAEALNLSRIQADSLARMSYRYSKLVDTMWTPLAKQIGMLTEHYADDTLRMQLIHARTAALDYVIEVVPHINTLLTKGQLLLIDPRLRSLFLDVRYWKRIRGGVQSDFGLYVTP